MPPKSPKDVEGLEYDWLASDANGHVALFSTAGGGHAPPEFLENTDEHDLAIDLIIASPISTKAIFAPALAPDLINTWLMMAERGIFAFDSDVHGSPYCRVAAPADAIRAIDLSSQIAKTVTRICLPLSFAGLSTIPGSLFSVEGEPSYDAWESAPTLGNCRPNPSRATVPSIFPNHREVRLEGKPRPRVGVRRTTKRPGHRTVCRDAPEPPL